MVEKKTTKSNLHGDGLHEIELRVASLTQSLRIVGNIVLSGDVVNILGVEFHARHRVALSKVAGVIGMQRMAAFGKTRNSDVVVENEVQEFEETEVARVVGKSRCR